MRKFCLFLILALLLPTVSLALQDENLLENGGFELLNESGGAVDWYTTAYRNEAGYSRIRITDDKAHGGRYSALVENASLNDARFVCIAEVQPNAYYRLSGYVFVESMGEDGNGANFGIEEVRAHSACLYDTLGEWEYIEWYGRTGPEQRDVTFGVRVGGYSAESVGKAYFDDITLVKLDALPSGVLADAWYSAAKPAAEAQMTETESGKSTVLFVALALLFVLGYLIAKPMLAMGEHRRAKAAFVAMLALALAARVVIAWRVPGYSVDINCFTAWSTLMAEVGPLRFYTSGVFCDYPPGYLLLLWPCGALLRMVDYNGGAALLIVKSVPILCDLATACVLYAFASKRIKSVPALLLSTLYLFNPAALVDGAAWGQADSVLALLIVLCAVFAIRRDWRVALPLFVGAILTKPQALLFAPVGGMWLLYCLTEKATPEKRREQWSMIAMGLSISFLTATLIIMPFTPYQSTGWLLSLYRETLSSYNYVTLNTANLYYLLGANWVGMNTALPALLPLITALLAAGLGVCLCYAKGAFTFGLGLKRSRAALLLAALAVFNLVLLACGGDYRLYCYGMMAFVYAFVLLCIFCDRDAKQLPFMMALAMIGVYVLGPKIHERYLFPALSLLLFSYATTRDRRVLWLAIGFSATMFVNTAIVLDNSILFGSSLGHLNLDTLALNDTLSVLNLLLCGFAFCLGLTGLRASASEPDAEGTPKRRRVISPAYRRLLLEPGDARLHLTARDWLVMGATGVLYAVLTFVNLGSAVAPQNGWISSSADEQITFQLDEPRTFSLMYYAGVSYYDFSVAVSEDGVTWSEDNPCHMAQAMCFQWKYATTSSVLDGKVSYSAESPINTLWLHGKYLRLNADAAGLNLFEIIVMDEAGQRLPISVLSHTGARADILDSPMPAENLIDEQDTFTGEPSWFNGMYFDEIYHARSAYHNLHGQSPYETTHPPLGKLLIASGIALFGMTPFGWRFAGALAGVLMLPALYLLTLQIFKKRDLATVAMLAFALDLMHFTQTRIATIDSFPVLFLLLSYLCMVRYAQTDVFALENDETPQLFSRAFWKSLIPLALSGLFMGLGIASKWIGVYSAIGLAVLFFITIFRQYRAGCTAFELNAEVNSPPYKNSRRRVTAARDFTLKRALATCGFCVLFFIAVPLAIYCASYIPYLSPDGPVTLKRILLAQQGMLSYHSTPGLGMDHPFQSPWWQWPLILKPMWFAQGKYEPAGYASTIMCMGNPWVFYIGAACMAAALIAFVFKYIGVEKHALRTRPGDGRLTLLYIVLGFLAQYLPWVLVPRSMYIYHYFASVPFIILATVWMLDFIPESKPRLRRGTIIAYVAVSAVFFAMFYPYASGMLTNTAWLDAMKWFSRLYY